jgi:predicted glutamine amidotransferase
MCRLLGYVAERPTSMVDVLGLDAFEEFTSLTAVHGDGWGMAWQAADHTIRTASSTESASDDPTYDELARVPLGRAGLVHLRWASAGLAVTPENTHPFVDRDVAFAHNGHIAPIDRLEALLTAESCSRLAGDTDCERYFRFVTQCIEETGDFEAGVSRALGVLTAEFPEASLNALMLTPSRMVAVHINSAAASPPPALWDLFESRDEIPARHTTEYFAMDYRATPDAVHVISSGLEEEGWTSVPPDTAAIVDLDTRAVTVLQI